MTRGLVVVEDVSRDEALLERARQFAEGGDADLVVVALATPEEYEELEATLEMIGEAEGTSYDEAAVERAVEYARADRKREELADQRPTDE